MSHSILLTGASGYLGGSLLAQLSRTKLPPHQKLYAFVRSQEQADAVKEYGAEPLILDLKDEDCVVKTIVDAKISIIYFLIDAVSSDLQIPMIKALGQVKKQIGQNVHFLHTSGAKMFSVHAGFPTDRPILDTDSELYEHQKTLKAPHEIMAHAMTTNNTIIETAESHGVRSYIFIPCIVFGAVYDINTEGASWPVCHVSDTTSLYDKLLQSILSGDDIGYGKEGYYLASSGIVKWVDIYTAIAKALAKRKVIDSAEVKKADDAALKKMAKALGCPEAMVAVQLGGRCSLTADRASKIGWKSRYAPEHVLETADAEVELILKHLKE
ncbi:NAD(P)-binding protein [Plenodomus tracheiphilus IPT5]|uniref:NAD(P)-binding protein n=1 Tax=Plenodomus tracheiphilus IPT5 TaxID=1408161 RepID=A0A6A7B768_9PLEO|nr:NAD(P)-binding protein [Plenodomus tracheiphilus IPT5]